jgi:predicted AAA+ superfamily ATPase
MMLNTQEISELEAAMGRKLGTLPARIRPFTTDRVDLPRALLLTGARGTGKTTFLLHHAGLTGMLYLSADNPMLAGQSLYDAVRSIFMAGYNGAIIDEVHFARDWSLHLKALYDDYPEHRLWVSDSSALILRKGVGDLSRRFVSVRMPLMSFREFLYLETGMVVPRFDPFQTIGQLPIAPSPAILEAFRRYRSTGTRPFYSEGDFGDRLLAVLDKTLYADIPFFLPNVTDGNLRLMRAITGTLAASAIPRLQVRSLCADWGIGADRLYRILEVMESVGLLRILRFERDTKARSVGAKLFFADPAFYSVLHGHEGTSREALVAALCAGAGWDVEASRDESVGDFVITRTGDSGQLRLTLEVGGPAKRSKRADFVIRDDLDYPGGNALPLWLLGMGY